eukprot:786299-Karenia_brevis.AAC.1
MHAPMSSDGGMRALIPASRPQHALMCKRRHQHAMQPRHAIVHRACPDLCTFPNRPDFQSVGMHALISAK